jgi:hypothetical protein
VVNAGDGMVTIAWGDNIIGATSHKQGAGVW